MSTDRDNDKTESVRDTLVKSIREEATRDPDNKDLQASADVVERNQRKRDENQSWFEPKEPDNERDEDKSTRQELKAQFDKTKTADKQKDEASQVTDKQVDGDTDTDPKEPANNDKPDKDRNAKRQPNMAAALPKEIAAEYDALPVATKDFLARQVKENRDLKAERGRKQYLQDVDRVLEPVMPKIKEANVSPAQVVSRVFQYVDALGNPQTQIGALAQLCQDFGIDIVGVASQLGQQQTEFSQLPQAWQDKFTQMETALNGLQQQQHQSQQIQDQSQHQLTAKAHGTIAEWADKAGAHHIDEPTVKATMHNLLANHMANYKGDGFGGVNLDKLYRDACTVLSVDDPFKTKPQARQQQQRTQQQVRTTTPKGGKSTSVRDSMRASIAQLKQQAQQRAT